MSNGINGIVGRTGSVLPAVLYNKMVAGTFGIDEMTIFDGIFDEFNIEWLTGFIGGGAGVMKGVTFYTESRFPIMSLPEVNYVVVGIRLDMSKTEPEYYYTTASNEEDIQLIVYDEDINQQVILDDTTEVVSFNAKCDRPLYILNHRGGSWELHQDLRMRADTGWQTFGVSNGMTGAPRYRILNNMVYLQGQINGTFSTTSETQITTLPPQCRPSILKITPCSTNLARTVNVYVYPDGRVVVYRGNTGDSFVRLEAISFFIN